MDFYLEFLRELNRSTDPESTLQTLIQRVKATIEKAPTRVALAEGAALLAVIHDYSNPKAIQILSAFRDLQESFELLLSALDTDLALEEDLWAERRGGYPSNGSDSEPQEGLSRRFLDFENIGGWGKDRWDAFVTNFDSIADIAATSPAGLDSMSHFLSNLHAVFGKIPLDSQETALTVADRLVLIVREKTETMMANMQDRHQMELIGNLDGWDDLPEGACDGPPYEEEADVILSSENHPGLDVSGWKDWGEKEWAIFDKAVIDAKVAAVAEPSDTAPAMYLFLQIRENIETLALHRKFTMGNIADDLQEAIQKGMSQDLFRIQQKCPAVPVPVGPVPSKSQLQQSAAPTSDRGRGAVEERQGRARDCGTGFDQIGKWNLSQWAGLKIEVDKLTAAAELTTGILGSPGQMLEDIRAHIQQVPQHYQGEVVQMAAKLERAIGGRVAEALAEIQLTSG